MHPRIQYHAVSQCRVAKVRADERGAAYCKWPAKDWRVVLAKRDARRESRIATRDRVLGFMVTPGATVLSLALGALATYFFGR